MFVAALTARIVVGDWQITDALVPLVMLALFPFFEWIIHVFSCTGAQSISVG